MKPTHSLLRFIPALGILLAPALLAQSAGAPRLGWLVVAGHGTQSIDGVPGAARFGAALDLPASTSLLALHPYRAGALLATAAGEDTPASGLAWWGFPDDPARVQLPAEILRLPAAPPDSAAWSPMGAFAVLNWRDEKMLRVYRLDDSGRLNLEWELPADASSAAVSDDGSAVLTLLGETITLHGRSASTIVATPGAGSSLTFVAGSNSFAYSAPGGVTLQDGASGVQFLPLDPSPPGDASAPSLLSPQPGSLLVLSAAGSETRLSLWSAQAVLLGSVSCPVAARGIEPTGQPFSFRLQVPAPGGNLPAPEWFASLTGSALRVFFVPPPAASQDGGELQ